MISLTVAGWTWIASEIALVILLLLVLAETHRNKTPKMLTQEEIKLWKQKLLSDYS